MLRSDLEPPSTGTLGEGALGWRRYLGISIVYGLLFLLCFYLGSFFALAPGGSLWYPAAGLRLATLLIFGWRLTPGLVVAEILAVAFYGVMRPSTRYAELIQAVLVGQVTIIYGAAAFVLTRYTSFDPRLPRLRDTTRFSAVAILVPLIGAAESRFIQVLQGELEAQDFVASTYGFFIGDAIGILMLTPALLMAWYRYRPAGVPAGPTRVVAEASGTLPAPESSRLLLDFLVIWAFLLAFHLLPQFLDLFTSNVHWYLAFLPMIWISFRHGLAGSITGTLALTSGAAWLSYLPAESIQFHELQVLVMFLSVTTLLMGSAISTQRGVESKLERQNRELLETQAQLEARNADLARFNYTVAHDLRNPLVTITNFLGLLRHDTVRGQGEQLEDNLCRLEKAADRMQLLLDDLFELSRVGIQTNPPENVPFEQLVHEALDELAAPIAKSAGAVEIGRNLPSVRGDRARLREVLVHLISNAIYHRGDARAAPRIEIGVRGEGAGPAGGDPVFYVRDNGIGVAPRYHEKIFKLFERLDPDSEGTGIGLTLVKRIVEIHGGRIWLESKGQGTGSTFCFTLPRADPESPALVRPKGAPP